MPDFTQTVGLSEPDSITLYKDNNDPNIYWAPPTTIEYAFLADGKTPVFSLMHYGIKSDSITGGLGVVLTASVRPVIDQKSLPDAWSKIKQGNPAAKIAVISPDAAFMDLILGSVLFDKSAGTTVLTKIKEEVTKKASASQSVPKQAIPDTKPEKGVSLEDLSGVVSVTDGTTTIISDPSAASTTIGGQVGAYQVFALALTPDAGAIFATNGGQDASNFGVRYRYIVSGIRSKVKAEITVNWSRLYDHVHKEASGGWFVFKANYSEDLQSLKESGAVKMKIIEGAFENNEDEFQSIYNTLVKAQINGEGIFKPTLVAGSLPGAPTTGGTFFGWSASGGWSHQRLEEQKDFTFTIDRQIIGKRSFAIGMGFQGMCSKYPKLFVAEGIGGPGCIDKIDVAAAASRYALRRASCETKQATNQATFFKSIGLLPSLDLQKIALNEAINSLSQSLLECIAGK